MKEIELDYNGGHVPLLYGDDDCYDSFKVEVSDEEYNVFLQKFKWWNENERAEFNKKHADADDEYFLLEHCPLIHKKIRAKLEEIAVAKWGETIKKDLFNFDIFIGWQPYIDIYGEDYFDPNDY